VNDDKLQELDNLSVKGDLKMRTALIAILLIIALAGISNAQKTVHVRGYRRKDGTVVRAHDRRAPKSSKQTVTAPGDPASIEYREPSPSTSPLDELFRLVLTEPYVTVDLGGGSYYTPGGTGATRPRRIGRP